MSASYAFYQMGRMNNAPADKTQENIANNKYAEYMMMPLANSTTDNHIQFATQFPQVMPNGRTFGEGVPSNLVNSESNLFLGTQQERHYEKLQLFPRIFATVPYMGRGYSNIELESQLQQGNIARGVRSISTITEQSHMNYTMYPVDSTMKERIRNTGVEDMKTTGWVHGGINTKNNDESYR